MADSPSNPYFAQVADQWDKLRAGYFTEEMRDAAIAKANLPASAVVADIGTGTGFVASGLAPFVARVVGFDASPAMLAVARKNLSRFANVELRESPGDQLPVSDGIFDGVFANMYLHHAPDPLRAIREMVRVLKTGGTLCITDLDTHDHAWLSQQIADLWLGFKREDLRKWFAEAGLRKIEVDDAEGTCTPTGPDGKMDPLNIFVAIGIKQNGD
jgi:ubiquinone/menaquinone biosynthesis C-methylase UbiE